MFRRDSVLCLLHAETAVWYNRRMQTKLEQISRWVRMCMLALCGLALGCTRVPSSAKPVAVIYDTDMLLDCGDAGGLACLHVLADQDLCEIAATVSCTTGNASVACCEAINGWFGRTLIPLGCVRDGAVEPKLPGHLAVQEPHAKFQAVAKTYGYGRFVRYTDSSRAPDATEVCCEALADRPDGSVVLCCVGYLTNVRNLLRADRDLVARKVKRLVVMGGRFPRGAEFNLSGDAAATREVLADWPTEIVFCGTDVGRAVCTGRRMVDDAKVKGPVKDLYALALKDNAPCDNADGHPSWDPITALVAVDALEGLVRLERGVLAAEADGQTFAWTGQADGRHARVVLTAAPETVRRRIDELFAQQPDESRCRPVTSHGPVGGCWRSAR